MQDSNRQPSQSNSIPARAAEWVVTAPSLLWLAVFFGLPMLWVLVLAFKPADLRGGVGEGWSLEAVRALWTPANAALAWRTLWMSGLTTLVCVAASLPAAWTMARLSQFWRNTLLLLIIAPFLTNFLIRVFAWRSLLHPEGALTRLLQALHLAAGDAYLLDNAGAVLLVMVYCQLPFALLPLYAAAEKFDFTLIDAARDLGATRAAAFRRVFIPGVRAGLLAAAALVFVSSLGQYVVPQFLGGIGDEWIGNKIVQRLFSDRNLPQAAALSSALLLFVLLVLAWFARCSKTSVRHPAQARTF